MGDHRCIIKIEFDVHDQEGRADWCINYSPWDSECEDLDQRVIDFFRRTWRAAYGSYLAEIAKQEVESRREEIERQEREELARLKAKYEDK